MKPKVLIFDLDGTLAESKQRLSADMGDLIDKLLAQMPVAIMSGGGWAQFETQFFPALAGEHFEHLYIFPDNAAQCFVHRNGEWHPQYDHAFTAPERERIMAAFAEALAETGLSEPPTPVWGERIEDRGAEITFSGLGQTAPQEAKKQWDQDGSKKKALRDALALRLPEFSVGANGSTSVDITRKDINKAYGVTRLAELTHTDVHDMLYIGDALEDGGNDSVVIQTGVPTHEVFSVAETSGIIERILTL